MGRMKVGKKRLKKSSWGENNENKVEKVLLF